MNRDLIKPLIVFAVCVIITFACGWFAAYLRGLESIDLNYPWRIDVLSFAAILAAMVSMLPLFLILTQYRLFENLALPLKNKPKTLSPSSRAGAVFSAILFSGITFFLFCCGLAQGLFPLPENISRFTSGNIFIIWIGFITLAAFFALCKWLLKGQTRKADWTLSDLGLEGHTEKELKVIRPSNRSKRIIPHAIIAAIILTGSTCLLLYINIAIFKLNSFSWLTEMVLGPFNLLRFLIYLPVFAAFFTINAGAKLYGQLRLNESKLNKKKSPVITQLAWWGFSVIVMLGGFVIAALIAYIIFRFYPSFEFYYTPILLIICIVPLFAVFFFFSTWFYRKSGTIYTGSFVLAILAALAFACNQAVF